MVLAKTMLIDKGNGVYDLRPIRGGFMIWLILETACFYLYMISNMIYILVRQVESVFWSATPISDMKKALTDFISYSSNNLTWFAFNFVLCTMPPICLVLDDPDLWKHKIDDSYKKITYTLWAMHVLAFVCQFFIYKRSPKDSEKANSEQDDQFKRSDVAGEND